MLLRKDEPSSPSIPQTTSDFIWTGCNAARNNGIIVSDQLPIGETVRRLLNLLNRVSADEMWNEIRWLQAFK